MIVLFTYSGTIPAPDADSSQVFLSTIFLDAQRRGALDA